MKQGSVFGVIFLATVAFAPRADEGRIPIYRATVVTETGSYFLSRDVPATSDAVRIEADRVTLDLGGHTIEMGATGSAVVVGSAVKDVTIKNGTIHGGTHGIVFSSIGSRARLRIENVRIVGPSGYGIYVGGAESLEVRGTQIVDAGLDAIYADGVSSCMSGKFVDNVIASPGRAGLFLRGLRAGELRGNSVSEPADAGIELAGDASWSCGTNRIEGNTIHGSGGASSVGIEIGAGVAHNVLTGNVVTGCTLQGITVGSNGNRVAENETNGNAQEGIRIDGSYNIVERNVATGNLYGVRMPCTSSRFRDNMLLGNSGTYCTGSCCSSGNAGGNLY